MNHEIETSYLQNFGECGSTKTETFSALTCSAHYCEDHFHSRLYPQFKYMTFIYSSPFIHHFRGLFGTNIMTRASEISR